MSVLKNKLLYVFFIFCIVFVFFGVSFCLLKMNVVGFANVINFFHRKTDVILENTIYQDLREEYCELNIRCDRNGKIVFVGDSITRRFNVVELSFNKNIVNRGIYSDTTLGLIERIDSNVNNLLVDKLFIMIGYNDLRMRCDNEIIENFRLILERVQAKRIYVQSLLPVSSKRIEVNRRIMGINDQLRIIAHNGGHEYIDLHSHFVSHGTGIRPELTRDGTHPNLQGNLLWYSLVAPFLD